MCIIIVHLLYNFKSFLNLNGNFNKFHKKIGLRTTAIYSIIKEIPLILKHHF